MTVQWADFPWDERLYDNADETILTHAVAAVENAFSNAAGGHSRFPGLRDFATTGGNRNYVWEHKNNLLVANDQGRVFRVGRDASVEDVTRTPLTGGCRPTFTANEDEVLIAAGGPILTLATGRTEILTREAPRTTHVGYVDGYVLAIEANTQRFRYADPGTPREWNDLNVFSADGKADNLNALVVTPYRELLLAGPDSIEQFERLPNGTQPFARRWATGEGVAYPYTLVAARSGTYGVNMGLQFVRFVGQITRDESNDIGLRLKKIDDWTDVWAAEFDTYGQKFIVLQAPNATNGYGTKGLTLLLDYARKRWSFLYGWDSRLSVPARWPGWSVAQAWGQTFVGVPGGVAVVDGDTFTAMGQRTRFLIRSAHVGKWGPSRIDDVRLRIKRGVGQNAGREPLIGLRVNRDNEGFDQWTYEPLGRPGQREMEITWGGQGCASAWQFEISVTDAVPVEFVSMQVHVERLRW